jgi:SAM-dependent methyltransferase
MVNKIKERLSGVEEVIDDFSLEGDELIQNLIEIEGYNKMLGGYDTLLSALNKTMFSLPKEKEYSLVDLGCGGADTMKKVADVGKRKGYKLAMRGVDANPFIVKYAQDQTKKYDNIIIETKDVLDESFFCGTQDFVSANLFLHHFSEDEIVKFIKRAMKKTNEAIIICDLHRNLISYYSFIAIAKIFGANKITANDGKISILKGFRKKEWVAILERAGAKNYRIKWRWAFRHQIIVYCR